MTTIASVSPANFLTLEALAVAITLDAAIATTTQSSLLESVAALVHVPVIALGRFVPDRSTWSLMGTGNQSVASRRGLIVPVARPEAVAAVVSLRPGETAPASEIIEAVYANLSRFKAPRHVVIIDEVKRGPNGKADYAWAKAISVERTGWLWSRLGR